MAQYWRSIAFQALNERDVLDRRLKVVEGRVSRDPEEVWRAARRGMSKWVRARSHGGHPLMASAETPDEARIQAELKIIPEEPRKRFRLFRRRRRSLAQHHR